MQIVIDIPKEVYESVRCHEGLSYSVEDYLYEVEWAIKKGTPLPQNATNGDVIKVMFPNIDNNFSNVIDLRLWWSRPYKAESEDKDNADSD